METKTIMKKLLKYLPILTWLSLTIFDFMLFDINSFTTVLPAMLLIAAYIFLAIEYDVHKNFIIYNNDLILLPTKYGYYFYTINHKNENLIFYKLEFLKFKKIDRNRIRNVDGIITLLQDKIQYLDGIKESEIKKKKEYSYVKEELTTWKPKQ